MAKIIDFETHENISTEEIRKPGLYCYIPEMGESEPIGCQLEAFCRFYSGHEYVKSPFELKGRGINLIKQYTAKDFGDGEDDPHIGWYEYRVTERAFENLKTKYSIKKECYLD